MRLILGVGLGVFASFFWTSVFTFLTTPPGSFNHPPWTSTLAIVVLVGIIGLAGFVGGFVGGDLRFGFLSGLLAGMFGVPVAAAYSQTLIHCPTALVAVPPHCPFLVDELAWRYSTSSLGGYLLFGLVGGTVGVFGAWIETRTHSLGKPSPGYYDRHVVNEG
ncbi:MAG: hypothetical protein ACE5IB_01240 [Candidatus Geothermarchaeales archaeon]